MNNQKLNNINTNCLNEVTDLKLSLISEYYEVGIYHKIMYVCTYFCI